MKLLESLSRGVYVNCLMIYDGVDLLDCLRSELELLEKSGDIRFNKNQFDLRIARVKDSRDCLDAFYLLLRDYGIRYVIFDEISTLLRRFGAQRPFRGAGGARAVAEHLKALLDAYKGISTIFSDTSINFHYELFREYGGPLFRQYQAMLEVEPLGLRHAIEFASRLAKKNNINVDEELLLNIADLSGGVSTYIEMLIAIVRSGMSLDKYEKEVEEAIMYGLLNRYFEALLDKFSWTEQEVLYAIAKGKTRFYELQRDIAGCAQALETLLRKGIVVNVKKGPRESYYLIKDKLFSMWLAMKEKPRLQKLSYKKARVLTVGFESLVREIFFTLEKEVRIVDELGKEITIIPPRRVYRYEGALGEVDMIAEYRDGSVIVGEIYMDTKCGPEKIEQLINAIGIAERLGYKIKFASLISYFEYPKGTIEYARKRSEKIPPVLLTERQLRELSKYSKIRLP